jgi:hypothetical protein
MRSRVRDAKRNKNAAELRKVVSEVTGSKSEDDLADAKKDAVKALKEMYDGGKAKMYRPAASGAAAEFPVDDGLRNAFGLVLDDLSKATDANVYVAFENAADLAPPPLMDKATKLYEDDPEVRHDFPKGNAPVIAAGNAFSPDYDKRRRATFLRALTESFSQVFDGQLLTLMPLEKGDDKKGKLVIDVSSRLYRVPDLFIYTSNDTAGAKRVTGLLFSFEVEWRFNILDRSGKILYSAPQAISKPTDAKFSTEPSDPDWAPYSILMDSAYYNYSREVTGRFGLVPPEPKAVFVYEGGATP